VVPVKPRRRVQRTKLLRAYIDPRHNEVAAFEAMLDALKRPMQLDDERLRNALLARALNQAARKWATGQSDTDPPEEVSIVRSPWQGRVIGFRWGGATRGRVAKRLPPSAEERKFIATLAELGNRAFSSRPGKQVAARKSAATRARAPARIVELYEVMKAERGDRPVTPRMVALRLLGKNGGEVPPSLLRNVQRTIKPYRKR
jgi:hypothetical protein